MPQYKSRVQKSDAGVPKKRSSKKNKVKEVEPDKMPDSDIGAVDMGGQVPSGGGLKPSQVLSGISATSGGLGALVPVTAPVALPVSAASGLASGIASLFGKGLTPDLIDGMTHKQMSAVVGGMLPDEFQILQGLAANALKQPHPLQRIIQKQLGGNIAHPKHIHRGATKDILKAQSPMHLANALEEEEDDMNQGTNVGGGLLDSIKHVIKKGHEYSAKYVPKAIHVGRKLNDAVMRGLQLAEQLGEAIDKSGLLSQTNPALVKLAEGIAAVQPYAQQASQVLDTAAKVASAAGIV